MIMFLIVDLKYSIVKNKEEDSHIIQNTSSNPSSLIEPLLGRSNDSRLMANSISNINYGTNNQNVISDPVNS